MRQIAKAQLIAVRHTAIMANTLFYKFFVTEMVAVEFGVSAGTVRNDIYLMNADGAGLTYNPQHKCWYLKDDEDGHFDKWAFNVLCAINDGDYNKVLELLKHTESIGYLEPIDRALIKPLEQR